MNHKIKSDTESKTFHRLKVKYLRLLEEWKTQEAVVTIEEISSVLFCSQRYARSLLKEMMEEGFIIWSSRPGRGAKGCLKCLLSKTELSNAKSIDTHEGYYEEYQGEFIDDDKICIPFYRPIGSLTPSLKSERAELHLIKMIHSCFTKLNPDETPAPDLAHKIEHSDDFTQWYFHLRTGLVWHNGESVRNEQLLEVTKKHLANVEFKHVTSVELDSDKTLVITLSHPDVILPYRLANPIYSLHHPVDGKIGLGAFAVMSADKERVILQRSSLYYGFTPLVQQIEYTISAKVVEHEWTTVVLTLPGESERDASAIKENVRPPGYVFMAFNLNKSHLTGEQQKLIRELTYLSSKSLEALQNINIFKGKEHYHFNNTTELPKTLSLVYFWSKETETIVSVLKKQLLYRGCQLQLHPIDAHHWFNHMDWNSMDMAISDLSFDPIGWLSTEERFKRSNMLRSFIPAKLFLKVERILNKFSYNETNYQRVARQIMRSLIRNNIITPLFSYIFQVKASPRIRGVSVSSQGWPDFTKIWIQNTRGGSGQSPPTLTDGR